MVAKVQEVCGPNTRFSRLGGPGKAEPRHAAAPSAALGHTLQSSNKTNEAGRARRTSRRRREEAG